MLPRKFFFFLLSMFYTLMAPPTKQEALELLQSIMAFSKNEEKKRSAVYQAVVERDEEMQKQLVIKSYPYATRYHAYGILEDNKMKEK